MTTTAKMRKNKNKIILKNGSVLILALIMASILLSVGIGISNIALKEIKLSSIGNESGIAFYTADTGVECALYWDLNNPFGPADIVFATSGTPSTKLPTFAHWVPGQDHYCSGWGIASSPLWNETLQGANPFVTTFETPDNGSSPCAVITVTKKTDLVSGVITTKIDSRGRSSPCDAIDSRTVERGLQVSY